MSSFNLDEIFTHIEVLKSREPEINVSKVMSDPFAPVDKSVVEADTPAALLNTICKKMNATTPKLTEEKLLDGRFKVKVEALAFVGEATAPNKRAARQEAARQLFLKVVDDGQHAKHHIKGATAEEARVYIQMLAADSDIDKLERDTISELQIYCAQKKIKLPHYEELPSKDKLYAWKVNFEGVDYGSEWLSSKSKAKKSVALKILEALSASNGVNRFLEKMYWETGDILNSIGLANYLQRIVIDHPPTTEADYENGGFEAALNQLKDYTNPDGEKLFDSIEFTDELEGATHAKGKLREMREKRGERKKIKKLRKQANNTQCDSDQKSCVKQMETADGQQKTNTAQLTMLRRSFLPRLSIDSLRSSDSPLKLIDSQSKLEPGNGQPETSNSQSKANTTQLTKIRRSYLPRLSIDSLKSINSPPSNEQPRPPKKPLKPIDVQSKPDNDQSQSCVGQRKSSDCDSSSLTSSSEQMENDKDQLFEMFTLELNDLLMGKSTKKRRQDFAFFAEATWVKAAREMVAWSALRHIYNFGNFRTTEAMPNNTEPEQQENLTSGDNSAETQPTF